MDKLQTQIMEYIKDYMDKTIRPWMTVKFEDWEYGTFLRAGFFYKWYKIRETMLDKDMPEILGHYDITAVLKYIHIKLHKFDEDALDWDTILVRWYKLNKEHSIPNKPLHLYTEQENESLIKLFEKLNEKQNWII